MSDLDNLPRADPDIMQQESPLATARWVSRDAMHRHLAGQADRPHRNPIVLGRVPGASSETPFFAVDDDRHIVTIAGSRSGKGVSLIMPNLLAYPGSVICIDPKGENAAVTARYRSETLKQKVVVLDPFGVTRNTPAEPFRGSFNPLDWVEEGSETIDNVASLADALVVRDSDREPHWNENARAFIKGVMLFLMTHERLSTGAENQVPIWTLSNLRELVTKGTHDPKSPQAGLSIDALLAQMMARDHFDGAVASAGALLQQMGDNERGGVLSTVRRHTEFLESPAIAENLLASNFDPRELKEHVHGLTLYLVLPEWRLNTHARWLRLIINTLLQVLQRTKQRSRNDPAVLFVLDEFASLGHLESIERAAAYIAGFGVKLWAILQDLSQLKDLYRARWETFLGNAGVLTAFGNSDVTTIEYLSRRLGETELQRVRPSVTQQGGTTVNRVGLGRVLGDLSRGRLPVGMFAPDSESENVGQSTSWAPELHRAALLTPDEVSRYFAREKNTLLLLIAGGLPLRLERLTYYQDPPFKDRASPSPYHA